MYGGLYEIKCLPTGRSYYGSSKSIVVRLDQHLRMLKRGVHHSAPLQFAWGKYGEDAFLLKPIAYLEEDDLLPSEQRLLDAAFTSGVRPYNCAKNAVSPMKDRVHSEETKRLFSESRTGRKNAFFGKSHSEASKEKISKSKIGLPAHNIGKPVTDEVKAKISASKKGKPSSKKGVLNTACRRGHLFDFENTYVHKGARQCRACRKEAFTRFLSNKREENKL